MILHDERRQADLAVPETGARLGRDPTLEIAFDEGEDVVSALHARIWREADASWWVEDLRSTNGTWLNGRRLSAAERLQTGDRLTLGQRGPALRVKVPGEIARTRPERAVDSSQPRLRLRRVKGGEDLMGTGREILIGRAATCTIPLRTVADTVVSKRHAVVEFDEEGAATITDLESKNGTFVNGKEIAGRAMLRLGDRIMLGWHGPLLEVRAIGAALMPEGQGAAYHPELQPAKTLTGIIEDAQAEARRGGAVRRGVFVRVLAHQLAHQSSLAFRAVVLGLMAAFLLAIVLVYRSASRETAAAQARVASAERALAAQLRSSTQAQLRAQAETARLRRDLEAARRASVSRAVLDSLTRRLREAETQAARTAPSGSTTDFSRVAAENQGAVGLVIVRYLGDSVMGSGFVITPSGYFVTNRHVVYDPGRGPPSAIEVVMADRRSPGLSADLVAVSNVSEQDVAILRIRSYHGPVVRAIDWANRGVRQGAPAALIGFPGGTQLAMDASGVVRTSMFSGVISQATSEFVRFGGVTHRGSSGSPVLNAEGVVVAMHFGGFREGQGIGFSLPIGRVRRWLPAEARAELGL